MSKTWLVLGIGLGLIIVLALAFFGIWTWFSRQALPSASGAMQVAGLQQPVEIVRDEYGVAHIYAHSPEDLFFAQGYAHAQDRFWQMEFQRRTAKGRLAEIFGSSVLGTDRYLRQFGFKQLTEQSYTMLDPETKRIVDAYSAGINAYIQDRKPAQLGLEFALLGLQGVDLEIEPWTPEDALIWSEMMVFDQSDRMRTELGNLDLLIAVGEQGLADLNPPYRADRPVIIDSAELPTSNTTPGLQSPEFSAAEQAYLRSAAARSQGSNAAPQAFAALGFGVNGGSNSFVVAGERTTTGMPLLANDPHMAVNMPALWYEVGMHCLEKSPQCVYNFRGFSLPGVPGILIGHNDQIAWGLTNAAFDAEDVFLERINPENPNQYEVNGEWVDMEIRREEIFVHGQDEPEVLLVRSTRNGVVASDVMVDHVQISYPESGPQLYALAYAWTALEPIRSAQAVMMVNRAQNWDEFYEALRYFDAGKQNWIYADIQGNIGYVMPGKVPVRAAGDGSLPVPGWTDEFIWTGFIPYEDLPHVFNPQQGYVATANNPQVRAEDYPYLLNLSHDRGQRAQRIVSLIENDRDGLTVEDMQAIQTDNLSLSALEIIPYLQPLQFDEPQIAAARDRLLAWDGQMRMESPEAALFNIFWAKLVEAAYNDQLPLDRRVSGAHAVSDALYFTLQEPQSIWWDDLRTDGVLEERDAALQQALRAAYAAGVVEFGENLDNWRWGALHTIEFRNATLGQSGIGLIEGIFNRGPYPTHGSESVVQKTCWSVIDPYEVLCIPALRQVIDLSNLDNSRMIHSVGQSGHPAHPHYDDFIDPWRTFQYHPSNWSRGNAEAGGAQTLRLEPAP